MGGPASSKDDIQEEHAADLDPSPENSAELNSPPPIVTLFIMLVYVHVDKMVLKVWLKFEANKA